MPLRRSTTGFRDQARFGLRIQLGLCPGARTLLQGHQPRFDEALAEAFDRRVPDGEGSSESTVVPALSRFEENTGARHFAGRMCPAVQELCELRAFLIVERHKILFLGHRWSSCA